MPLAVTHILTSIIGADIYRHYFLGNKRIFPRAYLLIIGIAGLVPDLDIVFTWLLSLMGIRENLHGDFHFFLFSLIFFIPAIFFYYKKNKKLTLLFVLMGLAVLLHIFLDYFIGGGDAVGSLLFYPFSSQLYKAHFLLKTGIFAPLAALDAVLLIIWLLHEEFKHKIKDYF